MNLSGEMYTIFKYKHILLDDSRFDEFKKIEYENVYEIMEYVVNNTLIWYIIQTKNNIFRFQMQNTNFYKHDILTYDDNEEYFDFISVKFGDKEERIEKHMKNKNHDLCDIL